MHNQSDWGFRKTGSVFLAAPVHYHRPPSASPDQGRHGQDGTVFHPNHGTQAHILVTLATFPCYVTVPAPDKIQNSRSKSQCGLYQRSNQLRFSTPLAPPASAPDSAPAYTSAPASGDWQMLLIWLLLLPLLLLILLLLPLLLNLLLHLLLLLPHLAPLLHLLPLLLLSSWSRPTSLATSATQQSQPASVVDTHSPGTAEERKTAQTAVDAEEDTESETEPLGKVGCCSVPWSILYVRPLAVRWRWNK